MPYQEFKEPEGNELARKIKKGYRLLKPEGTPDERYMISKYLKLINNV